MDEHVDTKILALCNAQAPGKSICPTDVAKALAREDGNWRHMMGRIRKRAIALARTGQIDILRKGKPVESLEDLRGVIRLRAKPAGDTPPEGVIDDASEPTA